MSKQPISHTPTQSGQALSTLLAVTAIMLSQYIPPNPPKKPPGGQTSLVGTVQEVARVQQRNVLFES